MSFFRNRNRIIAIAIVFFSAILTSCEGFYNFVNTRELEVKNNFQASVTIQYNDYEGYHESTLLAGQKKTIDVILPFSSISVLTSDKEVEYGIPGCAIKKLSALKYEINEAEIIKLTIQNKLETEVTVTAGIYNRNFEKTISSNNSEIVSFVESSVRINGQINNPFSLKDAKIDFTNRKTYIEKDSKKIYYKIMQNSEDEKKFTIVSD